MAIVAKHEFEGRGEGLGDVVVDGALGQEGEAEIAARETRDEAAVLLERAACRVPSWP